MALCKNARFAEWFTKKLFRNRKKKVDFGEKDFDWVYSKKTIPVYMPKAEVTIRPGFAHCGYMAAETENYVKEIEAFMGRKMKS